MRTERDISTRMEVWSEQPLITCRNPCKHCQHNERRKMHYLGTFPDWDALFAVMPKGRRMHIHRPFYSRFTGRRIMPVHFRIRRALR